METPKVTGAALDATLECTFEGHEPVASFYVAAVNVAKGLPRGGSAEFSCPNCGDKVTVTVDSNFHIGAQCDKCRIVCRE